MIPGGLYLADTSALARIGHPAVRAELDRLGRLGLLATCVTVDLEVLHSARSPTEYAAIARQRHVGFTDLPCVGRSRSAPGASRLSSPGGASTALPVSSTF